MKVSRWKKFLSYFKDVTLESTSSQFNPFLEVLLVNGRHQLVTENAIYSFDDKYENFNKAFQLIDWKQVKGKKCLVLGLGLGSVILLLEKFFGRSFEYTAVEIDPEICQLAHKYTLSKLDSFVEVINTDALLYLEVNETKENPEQYDLIIMDVFENALIPEQFQNILYLEILKSLLLPQGVLLFNRMNKTDQDKFENAKFEKLFKDKFPNHNQISVKDNIILINDAKYLS